MTNVKSFSVADIAVSMASLVFSYEKREKVYMEDEADAPND